MIFYKHIDTPIGKLFILCDMESLVGVEFNDDFLSLKNKNSVIFAPDHLICLKVEEQLREYFNGDRTEFTIPTHVAGTDFQVEVWKALKNIPYGSVKSYKDIAIEIKRPLAVRAIGQANRRNPIPIIVPCHRVIGKNNDLVGYAGDKIGLKEKLLKLEGSLL